MQVDIKNFPGGIRYDHIRALKEAFSFQPATAGNPANRDLLCIQTGWHDVITTLERIAVYQAHGEKGTMRTGSEDVGFASRMGLKGSQADVLTKAIEQAGG